MTELKANETAMETPSPTPEDDPGTESEAESDCSKPSVNKTVEKIVSNLEGAQTDTERLAALFLVTKAVRAEELDAHSRRIIFDAIGFTFLSRLLRAEGEALYKSVALSILTCFCTDPELVVHPQMLANIPVLLGIVADADTEAYQDDLTVVSEAYQCLQWIAGRWKGAQALLKSGAPSKLAEIYLSQSFKCEEALAILQTLAARCGDNLWNADTTSMTSLLNKISLEFEADNGEHKFELCRILAAILLSYPRYEIGNTETEVNVTWPSSVRRAIFDILRSKVTSAQRDPALRLSSLMVELLGISWAFTDDPAINSGGNTNSATFLLLLAQLSCVEVRMGLEEKTLAEATSGNGAELLTSCYLVLEAVLGYITAGQQVLELEAKQREQLYCALKGAYGAVLGFLHQEKQSQMIAIMERDFGIPIETAFRASETFLKQFRICPEHSSLALDYWRAMLWTEALGPCFENLAELIYYHWKCLRYKMLVPPENVISLLSQLGEQYKLALITNGPSHSQWEKIKRLDLEQYFECILVSDDLPWEKPHPNIFLRACELLDVVPEECVMIGDKLETDILGAQNAHLGSAVYIPLNPSEVPKDLPGVDWVIEDIQQLRAILHVPAEEEQNAP